MLKNLVRFGALAGVLSLTQLAHSQAMPTATGHKGGLQAGIGATLGKPDFGDQYIGGVSGFADYNFTSHIGVEGDVHYLTMRTPQDLGQETFEGGPRFSWSKGRFTVYGKGLAGLGRFVVQESNQFYNQGKKNSSSFMYSLGGGLDIDFRHHITLRAFDFEYQEWPNFANNGLTPAIGTVGVAYRFR